MPLEQFYIVLDNPSETYAPGQTVPGKVVTKVNNINGNLTVVAKDLETTFKGTATVNWKASNNKDKTRVYSSSILYFDKTDMHILTDQPSIAIPTGEFEYRFNHQLPSTIPSSFAGKHGSIEYILQATIIELPDQKRTSSPLPVTVRPVIDLKRNPNLFQPVKITRSKQSGCFPCTSQNTDLIVKLNKKGFYTGENMKVEMELKNSGKRDVKDVVAKLVQKTKFSAQGKDKCSSTDIFCTNRGQTIGSRSTDTWQTELLIPANTPPTGLGSCKIINVDYFLEVEAKDTTNNPISKIICPITIGNLPIVESMGSQYFGPPPAVTRPVSACSGNLNLTPTFQDSYGMDFNFSSNPYVMQPQQRP